MGLTWIDYDTIEKPIEEITVGTGEAKDIEFTVETLKCDIKKPGNGLTKKVEHKFLEALRHFHNHKTQGSNRPNAHTQEERKHNLTKFRMAQVW